MNSISNPCEKEVLRSTDLPVPVHESTGGFSLGGFSSLCCFAALGRDHHLALPAGASAFAVAVCIATVDSVGKFQDRPGCQQPLTALGPGLLLRALAWDFPPLSYARATIAKVWPWRCRVVHNSSHTWTDKTINLVCPTISEHYARSDVA